MSPHETILKLIRDKTVVSDLRRRSGNSDAVRVLQTIFKVEGSWNIYSSTGRNREPHRHHQRTRTNRWRRC